MERMKNENEYDNAISDDECSFDKLLAKKDDA